MGATETLERIRESALFPGAWMSVWESDEVLLTETAQAVLTVPEPLWVATFTVQASVRIDGVSLLVGWDAYPRVPVSSVFLAAGDCLVVHYDTQARLACLVDLPRPRPEGETP